MKIIPYLRFAWALILIVKFFTNTPNNLAYPEGIKLLVGSMEAVIIWTFVLYCILEGVQEITNTEFIQAIFFDFFGIIVEIITFIVMVLIFLFLIGKGIGALIISLMLLWQIGVLILIVVDLRKLSMR